MGGTEGGSEGRNTLERLPEPDWCTGDEHCASLDHTGCWEVSPVAMKPHQAVSGHSD